MSETKDCRVTISTQEKRGNLTFIVCDTGCGIDHKIKSKIFTTFFTTKGGGGTGLGLLTTRKIVKEHGGKITVRSRKGEGTEFVMTFPRKRLLALFREDEAE
jgi:signal transduction histidine kinase